jgi:hypothetical protein
MNSPQEKFCPVSSQKMEHLTGCASRASGLMHLLAVATVRGDGDAEISEEIGEGLIWLAMHTGHELRDAMAAAFSAPLVTLENPPTAV